MGTTMSYTIIAITTLALLLFAVSGHGDQPTEDGVVKLPEPDKTGKGSLQRALSERRSLRSFEKTPLTLKEISQILWAAQGITSPRGMRTAPSAGAVFPMTLFAARGEGLHRYDPETHSLIRVQKNDIRKDLADAALGQSPVASAPLVIIIAADVEKITRVYQERAVRYCDIEAGHIAQNIALQAQAIGLGMVPVGAFNDHRVQKVLDLSPKWRICYILPVGKKP